MFISSYYTILSINFYADANESICYVFHVGEAMQINIRHRLNTVEPNKNKGISAWLKLIQNIILYVLR